MDTKEGDAAELGRELEKAEADLAGARNELAEAERDVEKAAAAIAAVASELLHEFEVAVLYDGVKKPFEVRQNELVGALLARALSAFGPLPAPHTLALFSVQGNELSDSATIKASGIKPKDTLLLRPSTVKGG